MGIYFSVNTRDSTRGTMVSTSLLRLHSKKLFFFSFLFLHSKQDHDFNTHYLQLLQAAITTNSFRTHNSNSYAGFISHLLAAS